MAAAPRVLAKLLFLLTCATALCAAPTAVAAKREWTGRYENGAIITNAGLQQRLAEHKRWVESEGKEGKPADFVGADLSSANLANATLSWANLSFANLAKANLEHTNMTGTYLNSADLSQAELSFANLARAELENANMTKTNLNNATLFNARLPGATLYRAKLNGANMTEAVLWNANMTLAELRNSNMIDADLWNAHLFKAELHDANLSKAHLAHANMTQANLARADLSWAELPEADLTGAILYKAKLFKALMPRAILSGAKLLEANMTEAKLVNTDLSGAEAYLATFDNALLGLTNIKDAKLYGASLNGTLYAPLGTPDKAFLGELKGLSTLDCEMSFISSPLQLRKALQEAGLREQEREVTYSIERARAAASPFLEKWFKTLLFDWPSAYGMKPGRPLWLMWGFLLAFIPFYWLALWQGRSQRPTPAGDAPARKPLPLRWSLPLAAVLSLAGVGLYVGLDALMGTPLDWDNWHPPAILLGLLFPIYWLALWRAGCSDRKTGWPPLPRPKQPTPPSLPWVILGALPPGLASALLFVFPACECVDGGWPMRARVLSIFFLIIQPVFWVALCRRGCGDGIHQDWSKARMRQDLGGKAPVLLQRPCLPAVAWAAYFSLLSAFNLGFREINVGNWIARIQPREYGLRASGWVRFVSGAQSLLSFYLLALWVLTYFGRPFE